MLNKLLQKFGIFANFREREREVSLHDSSVRRANVTKFCTYVYCRDILWTVVKSTGRKSARRKRREERNRCRPQMVVWLDMRGRRKWTGGMRGWREISCRVIIKFCSTTTRSSFFVLFCAILIRASMASIFTRSERFFFIRILGCIKKKRRKKDYLPIICCIVQRKILNKWIRTLMNKWGSFWAKRNTRYVRILEMLSYVRLKGWVAGGYMYMHMCTYRGENI